MKKKSHLRVAFVAALSLVAVSCSNSKELALVYEALGRIERQIGLLSEKESKDSSAAVIENETICHLYASGVRYAPDFNWRDEPNPGDGSATLFLLCDGLLVFETELKSRECAEEDAHRIIGGRLYYDYCTSDSCFVMKENSLWAKWDGRFAVYDMASTSQGEVLCLRIPRQGHGFVLGNGTADLLSDSSLDPVGKMYFDGQSVCFKVKGDSEYGTVCCNLTSGKSKYLSRSPSGEVVGDYIIYEGRQYSSVIEGKQGLWIDGVHRLGYEGDIVGAMLLDCKTSVSSVVQTSTGICLYDKDGNVTIVDIGCSLLDAVCIEGNIGIVYRKNDGKYALYHSGTRTYLHSTFYPSTPVAFYVYKDRVALALYDENGSPAIFSDGELSLYSFNGCFTHLQYVQE